MVRQGSGWVMESAPGSPLPPYTPASAAFSPNLNSPTTNGAGVPPSPYITSAGFPPSPSPSASFGPMSPPMGTGPPVRSPLYANSGAQRTPRTPQVHVRSPSLGGPPGTLGGYGQSFAQVSTPLTNAGIFPPTPQVGSGFNIPAIPGTPGAGSSFNIPPAPGTPGTPSFGMMGPPPAANKRMSMPPPSKKKDD
jgi:hypothetical protein